MSKKHKPTGAVSKNDTAYAKADTSLHVHQRSKLKQELSIRDLEWTDRQNEFIDMALHNKSRITFVTGPAGTAKTLLAAYCSLHLLNNKKVSDIIYLRSAVESSEAKLGFLPGTADEKLAFYNLPFWDKMDELLPRNQVDLLKKEERVHCFPINYIRGLNWNAKAIILDETQNSSRKEVVTALTRLGEFTHLFILSDPSQTDLGHSHQGGVASVAALFDDDESKEMGVNVFRFGEDDIMRSAMVRFIVKKLNRETE